ncbi:MAG: hypothetical protein CMJ48_05585 [Planctomycetaceae bacterium]|nr:hypothetical protein [Planctomycetaceae bacterium]
MTRAGASLMVGNKSSRYATRTLKDTDRPYHSKDRRHELLSVSRFFESARHVALDDSGAAFPVAGVLY